MNKANLLERIAKDAGINKKGKPRPRSVHSCPVLKVI
jgi:hypothetical protein